MAFRLLLMT